VEGWHGCRGRGDLRLGGAVDASEVVVGVDVARLCGEQDLSGGQHVRGSLGLLALFVALSWTLAAFVEEFAFRGYLQTRMRDVLGGGSAAIVVAVLASSVLFGVLHSEQGLIGVLVVSLDAVAFSVVR
jgi:membrane protease YdiL (CAAX protease family)